MTFLPVVARELRTASRRWSTYILRLTSAAIAIALTTIVFFTATQTSASQEMGRILFGTLSWFSFVYCLFIGVRVTSDSISHEKREGTLGLLFLTDLKGYDVVLGKLVAHGINAVYALVAIVPVLAIPLLMGGVAVQVFWKLVAVLLNTIFFSISAGVLVSSMSKNERKAAGGTFALILFFSGGLPVLATLLKNYWNIEAHEWLLPLSPGLAFIEVFIRTVSQAAMGGTPFQSMVWISFALVHAMGWVGIVLAALITPRTWQEKASLDKKKGVRARVRNLVYGNPAQRQQRRTALLDLNAATWLSSRNRLREWWIWITLLLCFGFWIWGYLDVGRSFLDLEYTLTLAFIFHGVIKFIIAADAARIFSDDQKQGALELLLCTPMTERDIVKGHLKSLTRCFVPPLLVILAADILLVAAGLARIGVQSEGKFVLTMFVLGIVVAALDVAALFIVGLWQGLRSKNSIQAFTSTVSQILVLPWLLYFVFLLSLFFINARGGRGPEEQMLLFVWFLIALAVDLFFMVLSWMNLHDRMRVVAASRYEGRQAAGIWAKMGRAYGRLRRRRKQTGVRPADAG